jgi:hypothetical protein
MEDNLWPKFAHRAIQSRGIPDVAADVFDNVADADDTEEVWISIWIESVAPDIGAELNKPQSQPTAFEARVTGEEDTSAAPEFA